ncbi:MAG: M48 family metalloprotease [Treponema sp.]|nr:M48 family metalloprotease [Treponema sp.]
MKKIFSKKLKSTSFWSFMAALFVSSILFSSCVTFDQFLDGFIDDENVDLVSATVVNGIKSIEKASEGFTPEMEYYIGRSVAANITSLYKIKKVPETTEYLNKICSAITINSSYPYLYKGYFVAIIDSNEINAMATPGGHIFVTTGLLKTVTCEDEIAAVLAHEIAHIQLKHSITAIQSSRITDAILKTAASVAAVASDINSDLAVFAKDIAALGDSASEIVGTLVNTGFSVSQEFLADAYALKLMAMAGYDPRCMIDMLSHLENTTTKSKSGWAKTHPEPERRIANVKKELKAIKASGASKSVRQKRFNYYVAPLD